MTYGQLKKEVNAAWKELHEIEVGISLQRLRTAMKGGEK